MRAFALGVALCAALAVPAYADPSGEVGGLAAILTGTHVGEDNPEPVSGVVPGALLEARGRDGRVFAHLEGIPTITVGTSSSGPFGRSSATLGLLNATVLAGIDRRSRLRLGGGLQIVTLQNFNGNNGDRDRVRVSSPIYAAEAVLPLGSEARFVQLDLMLDPNVRGILSATDSTGAARPDEPEQGAEVDYAAAYGWRRGRFTYLVGLRGLSYHTRDLRNGELVDRNVGGGVTFEARYGFGAR